MMQLIIVTFVKVTIINYVLLSFIALAFLPLKMLQKEASSQYFKTVVEFSNADV
jgi:hypothetical protein